MLRPKRLLFDSKCNMTADVHKVVEDESHLQMGKDIEKIDDEFVYRHPSMILVNLTGKVPTLSSEKFLHPDLDPDEISSMGKLEDLMWLNIRGDHWKEICRGGMSESNSYRNPLDSDTVTRNVMDYLELQKELWKTRFSGEDLPTIRGNRSQNNNRSNHTVRMTNEKQPTCFKYSCEEEISPLQPDLDELSVRKLWFTKQGIIQRLSDGFDICFNLENNYKGFQIRMKDPAFILKAIILCLLNITLCSLAFVIFTPMFYTVSEYQKEFPKAPLTFLNTMLWISSHVSIFPVNLSTISQTLPPEELPTGWLEYPIMTKVLQILLIK